MSTTGPLKGITVTLILPITFGSESWSPDNVKKWITANGGKYLANKFVAGETTHLVCAEKVWRRTVAAEDDEAGGNEGAESDEPGKKSGDKGKAHPAVKAALDAKANGGDGVKIVGPKWLEDALGGNGGVRKPKAEAYLWERMDAEIAKQKKKEEQLAARVEKQITGGGGGGKGGKSSSHAGMLVEVLEDATGGFVSEEQKKIIEKEAQEKKAKAFEAAKEEAERKDREKEEERARKKRERKEQEALFHRGAGKGRNEIFSGKSQDASDQGELCKGWGGGSDTDQGQITTTSTATAQVSSTTLSSPSSTRRRTGTSGTL
jgi:hypothetical protein